MTTGAATNQTEEAVVDEADSQPDSSLAPGDRVFISYTADTAKYPPDRSFLQAAVDAVNRAGLVPVQMGLFPASQSDAAAYCRAKVRGCAAYVALIGFRYGSVVPETFVSFTEVEFREADQAGIPRFVFMLDANTPLPPSLVDANRDAIEAFRTDLAESGVVLSKFTNESGLGLAVYQSLMEALDARPRARTHRTTTVVEVEEPVRRAALTALVTAWRDEPFTPEAIRDRAVHDERENIRQAALLMLNWSKGNRRYALPLFTDRATTDVHHLVRRVAVQIIAAGWPDHDATPVLLRDLASKDAHQHVRWTALHAAVQRWRDDPLTLPFLCERIEHDPHENVRWSALQTLVAGWREHPQTVQVLRERAADDPHPNVRWAALVSILNGWPNDVELVRLVKQRSTTDAAETVRRGLAPLIAEQDA
jgi:Domain of unknown function (DUF4062)/HEAT repeats